MNLGERPIYIFGFGIEGKATARMLDQLGHSYRIVEHDWPPAAELAAENAVVIKSPGIPPSNQWLTELATAGVEVTTGLELWLSSHPDPDRVVLVTGTKGKSTTSTLIAHGLQAAGYEVFLGGNIGAPPWDPELAQQGTDYWVLETSSYQAAGTRVSAPLVVVTSLAPDHLPWHGDLETYYADKLSITHKPGCRLVIANGESDELRRQLADCPTPIEWVTQAAASDMGLGELALIGPHNRLNALLALTAIRELLGARADGAPEADQSVVVSAIEEFAGVEHRLQTVHTAGAIRFVDDTLSTNVLSTIAALNSFPGEAIAIILGGEDRGIDYTDLATAIVGRNEPTLVFTLPDNGPRIAADIRAADAADRVTISECDDLEQATNQAASSLPGGGVVLLSPAAPSFNAYADYRAKSEHFSQLAVRTHPGLKS